MSFLKRNASKASEKAGGEAKVTPADGAAADVETPIEAGQPHPPMNLKKFMAIFSLGCLLAAAQIPLYLIGGTLSNSPTNFPN